MANEAVIVELGADGGNVRDHTVADGVAITKGALLVLSDPRTAATSTGTGDIFAGIAVADKVASDGATNLGAYQSGVFDLKVNAGVAVTIGAKVATSGANLIRNATEAEIAAGKSVGTALETGSVNEVIEVDIGNR